MKALAYIRCSTEEQKVSGLGIEAQRQRIEGYCQMRGMELIEVFDDAGVSGGKPLEDRPAGSKVLEAVRKNKVKHVVVMKLDRAFRDAADCLNVTRDWDKQGVSFHILDMGGTSIDTSTAMGRMFLTMAAGFAELERNLIKERTKAALGVKRSRGERISRYAPFGSDFGPDSRNGNDTTVLVDNSQELATVQDMRAMRSSGWTLREIAEELEFRGIKTKKGNEKWSHRSVDAILKRQAA